MAAKDDSAGAEIVVVGARCAGAPLATHLARAGRSVVLLDAAKLPSDQTTSTHLIHPPGLEELNTLGIADTVRAASPALHAVRLAYDGHEARLPYGNGHVAHCLRRETLDELLQQAAVAAGAELRDQSKVVDLIRDERGTVRGVVVRRAGRHTERIHADLVVGADGRNSTIARLAAAEEYLSYSGPRSVYWAYWKRPSEWSPHEYHSTFEGRNARIIFPTDRDQLLIATVPLVGIAEEWRHDHTSAYLADIRTYRPVNEHLGDARPVSHVRGVLRPRYFFRAATGPGWALIGDARHHKEFVIGLGISDAMRDARGLALAISAAEDDRKAIERWWRSRDAEQVEMFYWSQELGRAQSVNALQRLAIARLSESPRLQERFANVILGCTRPYDFIPPGAALKWIGTALLRGETATLTPLVGLAARRAQTRSQVRRRRRIAKHSR
jgi:menaquinone-9 beta-reductase